MKSLLSIFLTVCLFALATASLASVSSSSTIVGASANYSVVLTNMTTITRIDFAFTSWTNTSPEPYSTSTRLVLTSGTATNLTVTPTLSPLLIVACPLSQTVTATSVSLTLTNMRNPSSTKPYTFTVTVYNSTGGSSSFSGSLTLNSISNTTFPLTNYSTEIGKTSTGAGLYLSLQLANKISNTYLEITYNSALVSIVFGAGSSYTMVSNISGSTVVQQLGSSSLLHVDNLTISNPQAATAFTINCRFYLLENNTQYNVQSFYASVQLTPAAFVTLSTSSTLQYGLSGTLAITSSCSFSQVNRPSSTAYTLVSYSAGTVTVGTGSNCLSSTSTACQHTLTNNYTLTSLTPAVSSSSSASLALTVTSYTYFGSAYYPLCQSTLSVPLTSQIVTFSSNLTLCSSAVSGSCTVGVSGVVGSVAVGDTLWIKGIIGTVTGSRWQSSTTNGSVWYFLTLTASDLTASTSSISVSLAYTAPSYTTVTNSLSSVLLQRSSSTYATSAVSLPLCSTTTPLTVSASSLTVTPLTTYSTASLRLQMSMGMLDYAAGDYLIVNFRANNSGNEYPLAGSYLGITATAAINGSTVSSNAVNSTALKVTLGSFLPSSTSPVLAVVLSNLVNPAIQSQLYLTVSSHHNLTAGTKQYLTSSTYTVTPASLTASSLNAYLLANNSLTVSVSNPNRAILTANSTASTTLSLTLPSVVSCPSVPSGSLSIVWNAGVSSSGLLYTGNTTQMTITFGSCYIDYFSTSPSLTISQTYNSLSSTSTSLPTTNLCGSNCYTCTSSTACTACFNSTHTTSTLLFNGLCYSSCPLGSYLSGSTCITCHTSCASCTGPSYLECSTCSTNYLNSTSLGYCLSVCGTGKYLSSASGACLSCHANCQSCTDSSTCYVCKPNATLINNLCEFTSCSTGCSACLGSQSTCTACTSSFYLYSSQCLTSCPSGTYSTANNTCQTISQPNAYVPVSIAGLVAVLLLLGLRVYASKKLGNERRGNSYKEGNEVNYKVNVVRVSAVVFGYLEIVAAVVLVAKNGVYGVGSGSLGMVLFGVILHIVSNVVFIVAYCCLVNKHRVNNVNQPQGQSQKSGQLSTVRHKVVLILSAVLSFRSYKLLHANLFIERTAEEKALEKNSYPNLEEELNINNPMGKVVVKSMIGKDLGKEQNRSSFQRSNNKNKSTSALKKNSSILNSNKQKQNAPPNLKSTPDSVPSKKPIRFNSMLQQPPLPPVSLKKTTSLTTPEDSVLKQHRKFTHPFLTYLTLANLATATLLILVGSCIQIYQAEFDNMRFWGIDALIVVILSLLLTAWDLWTFTNLKREEQNSEMSSQDAEVNHTHQNLKQAAQIQIQVQVENNSPKSSPVKVGSMRPKFSNRSIKSNKTKKSQKVASLQQQEKTQAAQEKPPMLKVFDDFDEKDQIFKETKTKKFSSKGSKYNMRKNKQNSSIANSKKYIHGELFDDLYINFPREQIEKDHSTTYHNARSQRSGSLYRSQEEALDLEGEFEEQPPNFADISQIQEFGGEALNGSQSEVPGLGKEVKDEAVEQIQKEQ